MMNTYTFEEGSAPLLVSVPHDGREIPGDMAAQMTDAGRAIPDTDWHVARLYAFVKDLGAATIRAEYSRYVIDLNRPADDAAMYPGHEGTGLCPTRTFAGDDIYVRGTVVDVEQRISDYWRPYHDKIGATLRALRETHGYALLWDAHSISSRVPRLFDGELPALNIGTWNGRSCDESISDAVMAAAEAGPYGVVRNGRFKGGHITRHYGRPEEDTHAIQLELAQRTYMDEDSLDYDDAKATGLRDTLRAMLETFLAAAGR